MPDPGGYRKQLETAQQAEAAEVGTKRQRSKSPEGRRAVAILRGSRFPTDGRAFSRRSGSGAAGADGEDGAPAAKRHASRDKHRFAKLPFSKMTYDEYLECYELLKARAEELIESGEWRPHLAAAAHQGGRRGRGGPGMMPPGFNEQQAAMAQMMMANPGELRGPVVLPRCRAAPDHWPPRAGMMGMNPLMMNPLMMNMMNMMGGGMMRGPM